MMGVIPKAVNTVTKEEKAKIIELFAIGISIKDIKIITGVSVFSISKYISDYFLYKKPSETTTIIVLKSKV